MKPIRTSSGVTPVTVLTKPFPCPGECIFCPNDVRMPKSYLSRRAGGAARRAEQLRPLPANHVAPDRLLQYRASDRQDRGDHAGRHVVVLPGNLPNLVRQADFRRASRLRRGHQPIRRGRRRCCAKARSFTPTATRSTSASRRRRCAAQTYNQVVQTVYKDEMRRSREISAQVRASAEDQRSPIDEYATWDELEAAHRFNESAPCRCVGLVIETRPDHISVEEVLRVRRLGCTKVQIGFQSLNDEVLRANRRGHTVAATRRAVKLLRQAGFKIHAHWMPNLYGSSPEQDIRGLRQDVRRPRFPPRRTENLPLLADRERRTDAALPRMDRGDRTRMTNC